MKKSFTAIITIYVANNIFYSSCALVALCTCLKSKTQKNLNNIFYFANEFSVVFDLHSVQSIKAMRWKFGFAMTTMEYTSFNSKVSVGQIEVI